MSVATVSVRIPDLLANWPWEPRTNCLGNLVEADELNWISQFPEGLAHYKTLKRMDAALAAACFCPDADQDQIRLFIKYFHWVFVFDDASETAPYHDVIQRAHRAIQSYCKSDNVVPGGDEIARQLWHPYKQLLAPSLQARSLISMTAYICSVTTQVLHHNRKTMPTIDEYLQMRSDTAGTYVMCNWVEWDMPLPDFMSGDPIVQRLTDNCVKMIFLANDLYSFARECKIGDPHNALIVAMYNNNWSLDTAVDWLEGLHSAAQQQFIEDVQTLNANPLYANDSALQRYIDRLGQLVRGNTEWSYRNQRYFGSHGEAVRESGYLNIPALAVDALFAKAKLL